MSKRRQSNRRKSSAHKKRKNQRPVEKGKQRRPGITASAAGTHKGFQVDNISLIILVLVTFLAYANAWPNNLSLDDSIFSLANGSPNLNLADIGLFFTEDLWASIGGGTNLYRPLLLVSIAIDMQLFGGWMAGYHLTNILLHILVCVAIFGFIRHLLSTAGQDAPFSTYIALLASLVFAVHPIHTEVVNSIFNRSDMLVTLGVVGGLLWFLRTVELNPLKAWSLLGLIYFLVLLCKETGAVLPVLAVLVLWLTTPGKWSLRLRKCLPVFWLLIPLGIYLGLRFNALGAPAMIDVVANTGQAASGQQALSDMGLHFETRKILLATTVWFDSLKLTLWPHPLFIFHTNSETNALLALSSQLILIALAMIGYLRKSPGFLMGLMFFYVSILPSSRIIGEAGMNPHVAERYLYLPSVGLAILLAFGLCWLMKRVSFKAVVTSTVIALIALTPLTWARNADWASTLSLAESDYLNGNQSGKTLQTFVSALLTEGEFIRAARLCDQHADEFATNWFLSISCGQAYQRLKRYKKAEEAFHHAMANENGRASAHYLMAEMYLVLKRRNDAKEQFEQAIVSEKQEFMKEYLAADMLMQLYPMNPSSLREARTHLEKAVSLQPQFMPAKMKMAELDQRLNAPGAQRN